MNQFFVVGKIIDEPFKGETSNGLKFAKLKVAVEKNIKEQEDITQVFEIAAFRSLSEEDFKIGQTISVLGRLQANNFGKDNNTYYNCNLIANQIAFL